MTDVLVVAENRRGTLANINAQLVAAATALAGPDDAIDVAVVGEGAAELAEDLDYASVERVHAVEYDGGFNGEVYMAAVADLCRDLDPRFVVLPHTVSGMDYAPAVASELDLPILTKMTAVAGTEPLRVVRKAYNSKVDATVAVDCAPVVVTVWEDEFESVTERADAEIVEHDLALDEVKSGSRVVDVTEGGGDVDITDAEFILSIGRGIEDEENLDLVRDACDALGATLAGSRPLIESGWLPKERQVGQSGQVVTPKVYVAVGISGAVEHLAGMKGSETIVAINTDEGAPIFEVADYGVVADLFDVVPALVEDVE